MLKVKKAEMISISTKPHDIVFEETTLMGASLNILLVEDNKGDVVIVNELLKYSGIRYILKNVSTLKEVVQTCRKQSFDIILLDLGLPDSIGLETLNSVKSIGGKAAIVVMTGLDDEDIALASLREGAQDYLVKNSLTSNNLLRAIKYGIERKNIIDLLERHNHQFSLLSTATAEINECEDIFPVYKVTSNSIRKLLVKAETVIIEFDSPVTIHASDTEWLMPMSDDIKTLTGVDMNNLYFHITAQEKEMLRFFDDGKLHEIKGGFKELFNGIVDAENCVKLAKLLDISNIYAIGFIRNRHYYGGVVICSQKVIDDDDIKIIEAISSQASLSIHRRSVEKDLKLSESRFRKLNKVLERKVTERTHDLETLVQKLNQELIERSLVEKALKESEDRLKDINATKDKFFSIIAHDLKSPFNSIIGFSNLLAEHINQKNYDGIEEYAGIIQDSSWRAMDLLTNLMEWSRTQTGRMQFNPEKIEIASIINQVTEQSNPSAQQKSISISKELPEKVFVHADKAMISTILRNLISNAIKFTKPGGKIRISELLTADELIISVIDTGVGLDKETISKLFRFDQIAPTRGTQQETGTGLGLILCNEFITRHGGKLWAEGEPGKGSTFSFTLPLTDHTSK